MPPNRRALWEQVLANLGQGVTWLSSSSRTGWLYRSSAGRLPTQCSRSGHLAQSGCLTLQYAVQSRRGAPVRSDKSLPTSAWRKSTPRSGGSRLGRGATDTGLGALQAAVRGENHREPALEDGIRPAMQSRPGKAAGRRSAAVLVLLAPPPRGPVAGADPVGRDAAPLPPTGPRTGSAVRHSAVPPPRPR